MKSIEEFHSFHDKVVKIICDATERVCKTSLENAVKIDQKKMQEKVCQMN